MQNFLKINERDNVAVALREIRPGERFGGGSVFSLRAAAAGASSVSAEQNAEPKMPIRGERDGRWERDRLCGEAVLQKESVHAGTAVTALEKIPAGHKMALCDIPAGGEIVKYGYRIGIAAEDIPAGAWVHTHNLKTALGDLLEYSYHPVFPEEGDGEWEGCELSEEEPPVKSGNDREKFLSNLACSGEKAEESFFRGFVRSDGSVGVRNDIWIIPTVGCVNKVAAAIAGQAAPYRKGTVDQVIAFSHPYGCSQMGEDQENTRKILADLIGHPNAGGVLVLGLGCENSGVDVLKSYLGDYDENRIKFLVAQEWEDEIEEGVRLVRELIDYAFSFERRPVCVDKLIIGMKCGGSDGFSGITANPLVGRFSDRLIARGGTTILTEVPEMFGAETILMDRCANEELFGQTVALINDFKQYFKSHNQTIYENPSPGNKAGGISTLEDKSLGCTQKSGSAPVRGVLQYGEKVRHRGLNLLSAPGNDLVASTALAAAGAQIVLFTTGRGTPFASPVPTVKISSNSALAGRKANWIDFDAGVLAEESDSAREAESLYRYVLETASGKKVRSEIAGYHDIAIFKGGVTL